MYFPQHLYFHSIEHKSISWSTGRTGKGTPICKTEYSWIYSQYIVLDRGFTSLKFNSHISSLISHTASKGLNLLKSCLRYIWTRAQYKLQCQWKWLTYIPWGSSVILWTNFAKDKSTVCIWKQRFDFDRAKPLEISLGPRNTIYFDHSTCRPGHHMWYWVDSHN